MHEFAAFNRETAAGSSTEPLAARMVVQQMGLHRDAVYVRKLSAVCQYIVDTGNISILDKCVILDTDTLCVNLLNPYYQQKTRPPQVLSNKKNTI